MGFAVRSEQDRHILQPDPGRTALARETGFGAGIPDGAFCCLIKCMRGEGLKTGRPRVCFFVSELVWGMNMSCELKVTPGPTFG
jgi:hypothetical protein